MKGIKAVIFLLFLTAVIILPKEKEETTNDHEHNDLKTNFCPNCGSKL